VSTFLFIGYHFGSRWEEILRLVDRHLKEGSIVLGIAIVIYLAFRYWSARRRKSQSA